MSAQTQRLTETEVHSACVSIAAQGERPTALTLLEKLGRGSLTTITKYLNSWNASAEAKNLGAETLPAIVKLPPELTKDGEDLIKKIWSIAKGIADEELDIQRDALKQAELVTHSRVEEAFKFSEAQAMKIERLEDDLSDLKSELAKEQNNLAKTAHQLNEAEKGNVGLSKDNDRLDHEVNELKKHIADLEDGNKVTAREKQELLNEHADALKQKDAEIRAFDIQVHELKTSLDSISKSNGKLNDSIKQKDAEIRSFDIQVHELQKSLNAAVKSNEQLVSDLKNKESKLSGLVIELEKLSVRHETTLSDLNTIKAEFKTVNKITSESEKQVANLKGQLEVYKSLEKPKPVIKALNKPAGK
jgi:chromosome segregation ATPase